MRFFILLVQLYFLEFFEDKLRFFDGNSHTENWLNIK
jgi:hypothetical protein